MATTKLSDSGTLGNKYENLSADNNYMETIASTLVGSGGVTSIIFSNIPQGYKHLQIRVMQRLSTATTDDQTYAQFNNDSGTNYAYHFLYGTGATVASSGTGTGSSSNILAFRSSGSSSSANIFGVGIMDILDYASTNKFKTARTLTGSDQNGSGTLFLWSGLWQNTAAINSITLTTPGTGIAQYSRFSLYGIKG
jgi:hypothetical protein